MAPMGPSHRSLVSPVKAVPGRIAGGQTGYSTTARDDPLRCSAVGCNQKLPARQGGCDWCPVHCPGETCQSAAHQRWAAVGKPIGGNSPHIHVSKRVHAQPNPAYQPSQSATPTTAQSTKQPALQTAMQAALLPAAQPTMQAATQAALLPAAQPTMQVAVRAVMQLAMQPSVQNNTSAAQRLAQICLLQLLSQQQQQQPGPR